MQLNTITYKIDFHGCADNSDKRMEHRQFWCLNNVPKNKVQSSMKATDHSQEWWGQSVIWRCMAWNIPNCKWNH